MKHESFCASQQNYTGEVAPQCNCPARLEMSDPKARVVEILGELGVLLNRSGSTMLEDRQFLADRLASAGLLASAPVVPSITELDELIMQSRKSGYTTAEFIRNHLLTLGFREKV